jgi:hypothetical protein
MRSAFLLLFAAFVALASAATGQIRCTGGNFPSPGTSAPYTAFSMSCTVIVAGALVPNAAGGFDVTGSSAVTVTPSSPGGSWSVLGNCGFNTPNANVFVTNVSSGGNPYSRSYYTISGNFANINGSFVANPASYLWEGGPGCFGGRFTVNNFAVTLTAS